MTPDDPHALEALLAAHGLTPDPGALDELRSMFPGYARARDALYAVPEARYEVPALVFEAAPKLDPWAG
jgi:hypothetical protein